MATPITADVSNSLAAGASGQTRTPAPAAASLSDESTFLKLLVAQLKNQDPQNPADGTQFVTQLAQFSGLEQQIGIKTDLDQILAILKTQQAQTNPATATAAPTAT